MHRLILVVMLLLCLCWPLTPAAAAEPQLAVLAPADGAVIQGNSVKVEFKTSGLKIVVSPVPVAEFGKRPDKNKPDEGHIHLTLDLWPLVVWEKAEAYTFSDVPPGEHQLKVELVNNDHSAREPAITQVIRFRTQAVAPVPARMPTTGNEGMETALTLVALCLIASGCALRRRRVIY